jgi:hypothetical protein
MRNTIDTDQNNDMRRAIGEGLRTRLRAEPELPQGLEAKIDELRRLEGPRGQGSLFPKSSTSRKTSRAAILVAKIGRHSFGHGS